jgi:hypothetical protein
MREVNKNVVDREQIRAAKKRTRLTSLEEKEQILAVAGLPNGLGLKFLWRLLGRCGTFASPYEPGHTDFLAGRQDVGLQLLEDMNRADPRIFVAMYNLNLDEEESNAGESGRSGAAAADDHPGVGTVNSEWDYDPTAG